jgi:predicted AlkP superfamily pyrophosphatase or phosphodiesterase
MPTYTAPGHASIYTERPANHGIVSNEWFSRKLSGDVLYWWCIGEYCGRWN